MGMIGCGYTLRGNTRPFFEVKGIRTLYVAPSKNNSFKAGVEITVYNALRKRIAQGGYVRLVDDPKRADARIEATVQDASYTPSAITRADQLTPLETGPDNVQVATSYNVRLTILFNLLDKENVSLWTSELGRNKSFAATTYIGDLGNTSGLINESEFERALGDLSAILVSDAEESINTLF